MSKFTRVSLSSALVTLLGCSDLSRTNQQSGALPSSKVFVNGSNTMGTEGPEDRAPSFATGATPSLGTDPGRQSAILPTAPASGHTVGIWYSTWYATNVPPPQINTWTDWKIPYVPRVLDQFRIYDSGDPAVIDGHIQMITSAGIDFILLDLTNSIGTEFILQRARAVCNRIVVWNNMHPTKMLKFAVAIGDTQWADDAKDIESIESEAGAAWSWFVQTYGIENYFHWNGKPLLVANDQGVREKWNSLALKPNSDKFTFKWWNGSVSSTSIAPTEYGNYVGWAFTGGALPSAEAMVVMPGWDNAKGATPVDRNLGGVEGGFYQNKGWDQVFLNNPKLVVINSFNEFAENTGVEPANTDNVANKAGTNKWSSPDFYWNLTIENIAKYRSMPVSQTGKNPMVLTAGFYGVNGSIYYSSGGAYCSVPFIELYKAIGSPSFAAIYAEPNSQTFDGMCAFPPGYFRVGVDVYYSNGSAYCYMNKISNVSWWQSPSKPTTMKYNGNCET